MSGHSKWSQIKRSKAITDTKRGKLFNRYIRELQIASRLGGPNPEGNARLRFAIETARRNSMPSANIERAIARGSGADGGAAVEDLAYEVYGPAGVAIMIEAASDNRNRTAGEMRHILSKYGATLAESGSVGWMFAKRGQFVIPREGQNEDTLMMLALDAGADDMKTDDPDFFEILTRPEEFERVRAALTEANVMIEEAKVSLIPNILVAVEGADEQLLEKLVDALEDNDDVVSVYTNAETSTTETTEVE